MLNKKFWFSCYIQKVMSGSYQGDVLTCIDWALRSPFNELGWAWISCNLHLRETNFKLKNVGFGLSLESSWQACFHGIIALHQFSIPHKFECCEGFWAQPIPPPEGTNFAWANVLNWKLKASCEGALKFIPVTFRWKVLFGHMLHITNDESLILIKP